MCGIMGFVGGRDATPLLIEGLKNLEYRGYDSCGIALSDNLRIITTKASGRMENLIAKLSDEKGHIGIGHTRWATHGEPNEINSHPHFSDSGRFAVVHNGIIENYREIKKFLTSRSYNFVSQTDSEVIAHLIEYYYSGDMLGAIIKSCNRIRGSYALGIISLHEPDVLYAVRKESPLVVGLGSAENYIASDMPALLEFTRKFIMLEDGEIAKISKRSVEIFNNNRELLPKKHIVADWEISVAQKDGYPHFMLKEIYEQPTAIKRTLDSGFDGKEIADILPKKLLASLEKIQVIACGSAYNAGIAAKYFFESLCRVPMVADVASEFRYNNPIVNENTLALIISQSGETADTLMGLRLAKSKGAFTLAIVNVVGSSIAREADYTLYTRAGTEIAVATTKGYTTQLCLLIKLAIKLAKEREALVRNAALYMNPAFSNSGSSGVNCKEYDQPPRPTGTPPLEGNLGDACTEGNFYLRGLQSNNSNTRKDVETNSLGGLDKYIDSSLGGFTKKGATLDNNSFGNPNCRASIPMTKGQLNIDEDLAELDMVSEGIRELLGNTDECKQIAYNYFSHSNCFFLGRNIDYALAMEGALKYKEISYIHAECYPAGELKHGTISLIEKGSIVITCATNSDLIEKTISNIKEVRSRGATCIVITPFAKAFEDVAHHIIKIPSGKFLAPVAAVTTFQLISYYVANNRGCDIDKPRNLAKSVTVE